MAAAADLLGQPALGRDQQQRAEQPAAEAAAGDLDGANADIQTMHAHIDDVTESGQGEVAEQLRPFYLEYLRKHKVTPK